MGPEARSDTLGLGLALVVIWWGGPCYRSSLHIAQIKRPLLEMRKNQLFSGETCTRSSVRMLLPSAAQLDKY